MKKNNAMKFRFGNTLFVIIPYAIFLGSILFVTLFTKHYVVFFMLLLFALFSFTLHLRWLWCFSKDKFTVFFALFILCILSCNSQNNSKKKAPTLIYSNNDKLLNEIMRKTFDFVYEPKFFTSISTDTVYFEDKVSLVTKISFDSTLIHHITSFKRETNPDLDVIKFFGYCRHDNYLSSKLIIEDVEFSMDEISFNNTICDYSGKIDFPLAIPSDYHNNSSLYSFSIDDKHYVVLDSSPLNQMGFNVGIAFYFLIESTNQKTRVIAIPYFVSFSGPFENTLWGSSNNKLSFYLTYHEKSDGNTGNFFMTPYIFENSSVIEDTRKPWFFHATSTFDSLKVEEAIFKKDKSFIECY